MMIKYFLFALLLISCADAQKNGDNKLYAFKSNNAEQVRLSKSLNEISGLAISSDGNLFAHNDEMGIIYQIDAESGRILKDFQVGAFGVEGDFEGFAIAGNKFFLLESNGTLYQFEEGRENEKVELKIHRTRFSDKYEFEGLCYNHEINALLLAVKEYSGKKYKNMLLIFKFSLKDYAIESEPVFAIELKSLQKEYNLNGFYPSGIALSPLNGNYYIISSKGSPAIVEMNPKGEIINASRLDKALHHQPEAISIMKDGTLLIGDEKGKKSATLTRYMVKKK